MLCIAPPIVIQPTEALHSIFLLYFILLFSVLRLEPSFMHARPVLYPLGNILRRTPCFMNLKHRLLYFTCCDPACPPACPPQLRRHYLNSNSNFVFLAVAISIPFCVFSFVILLAHLGLARRLNQFIQEVCLGLYLAEECKLKSQLCQNERHCKVKAARGSCRSTWTVETGEFCSAWHADHNQVCGTQQSTFVKVPGRTAMVTP